MKPVIIAAIALAGFAHAVQAGLTPEQIQKLPPPATQPIDFARDIKPILETSCVKCHGQGKDKGGFRIDTHELFVKSGDNGPAVLAGKSAESYLIELVSGLDPDNVMPVKGSKLTATQVGLLRAWIDQGMKWDDAINFGKKPPVNLHPRAIDLPAAKRGLENPIDRLLAPYFAEHKLKPGKPVDDRAFARRVYLDVIGLLPSPQEMEQFLGDKRADKREQLVTRLLADGVHGIGKKVVEEAAEAWMAAEFEGKERAAAEISQLIFFTQVLMIAADVSLEDVYRHL